MPCDIEIRIFGKVSEPAAIWELATEAAASAGPNYYDDFDREDFLPMLVDAAAAGKPVILRRGRVDAEAFEEIASCCREAGLSHVVRWGWTGVEGFTNGYSWQPGESEDLRFTIDVDGKATLGLSEVKKAAAKGIEAVNALVDRTANATRAGAIQIEPGFIEAYEDFVRAEMRP